MDKNKRPQILIVVYHPVGGIRTYFRDIYGQSLFDGYDFTVLTPGVYVDDLKEYVFRGRQVEFIPFKDNLNLVRCVWSALGQNEFGLVHSHGFTSGLLASLPVYVRRVQHLMTAHDIFQKSQFKGFSGFVKRWLIGLGVRIIDCNMAVSCEARDNFHEYFPFLKVNKKLIAIQNGIDVVKFSDVNIRDLRRELDLTDDCILFGFFGRFMKQKGFRFLVDAVAELKMSNPTLDFRVIAFGWGGFIREEQENISRKGLVDLFIFMPHTDDVPAAVRGVDAVIMPSLWEACPLLPMEVMVSGVPLIASDCIGLREVVVNTPAIVFKFGDVSALVAAMMGYFKNCSQYHESAFAFTSEAYVRFDVKNSAKKLYKQYLHMMENS